MLNRIAAPARATAKFLLGSFAVLLITLCVSHKLNAQTIPRERRFSFEYAATVRDVPAGAKQIDLWLPVPHDGAYQQIERFRVESPYPYEIKGSQYGNKSLHVRVLQPKQANFTVVLRFDALRREHLSPALHTEAAGFSRKEPNDPDMRRWLQPDRLVPLDAKVKTWAEEVVTAANAHTDLEKARAIYNHIVATVKYDKTGKGWGNGDIYYACDARRGNCTDFHAIFIGYARSLGIPARFAIGFPLPADRGAGQISGYHCWAEFYTKETGWVPVDASEAAKDPKRREYFFGAHDENRVEFTRGRDLALAPAQAGAPLNYFVYPYAEVDGQPYTALDRTFKYADHSETKTAAGAAAPAAPASK